jgi:hypothetical protein
MDSFTPILSTVGGVLIGLAAIALLYFNEGINFVGAFRFPVNNHPKQIVWQ